MTETARPLRVPALILGGGAAGLMCAAQSGPGTVVVEHRAAPGEKIRISGGGRCNFTNLHAAPENFLSGNPHFAKSALSRYTQWDFIDLVERHRIGWHEKTLGQLFCDGKSAAIIAMLMDEVAAAGAEVWPETTLDEVAHRNGAFHCRLTRAGHPVAVVAETLVVASGGKSIPKIGATGRGYAIARDFGVPVTETRPGLVPLTFGDAFGELSGVACPARVGAGGAAFEEALLFTHRGLSGPAVLQASSYWQEGTALSVCLRPDLDFLAALRAARAEAGRRDVVTVLSDLIPKRLAAHAAAAVGVAGRLADLPDAALRGLVDRLVAWELVPTGTEGYRKAEVTLGGVDTHALDARTMQARDVPGLHFIGEVVDVTGWLGGYNFQWAWSSGWAAGQAIAARRQAA